MIELKRDRLEFSFPEVHPKASLAISFQRTLRVPDDGRTYPLPPGLGNFPIRHVDDYSHQVPSSWIDHGGVMGVDSQEPLERLLSVNTLMRVWHGKKLDGNKSADPKLIVTYRNGLKPGQVRESDF